jgi:hypothetical protein
VDGRRFEVCVAPADVEGEFRMLVVRATIVLNPNAEAERSRAENVAKPFMTRSCGGQPCKVLEACAFVAWCERNAASGRTWASR